MISFYRSVSHTPQIAQIKDPLSGSWIRCERPGEDELAILIEIGLDEDILRDSLDPHEVPRIDSENGWAYFITRLPDTDDDFNDFTTPILFAIGEKHVVTVSRDPLGRLWQPFIDKVHIPTTQKTKLFMHMVDAITRQYGTRVAQINRQMRAATSDVRNLNPKEITRLVEYERKLNDYLDALIPTNTALEKLLSGKIVGLYDDDRDLVEDLSIDLEQLIARCTSLLRTITNLRDSYRAVMDTRLNETMRILTVITMAFTIPTMVAGLFGMNVDIPGANMPMMFWVVIAISAVPSLGLIYYFMRKR
ncbi:Magnesium transport protein CorA [compost metagenome]|jgi:magnesium transporter